MSKSGNSEHKGQELARKSTTHTFEWFSGILGFAAILIVIVVLKVSLPEKNSNSDAQQASPVQSGEIQPNKPSAALASQVDSKPPTERTDGQKHNVETHDLELPIPEDVEAIARHNGNDGPPRIGDFAVLWQKKQDKYIDFLRTETFEQGLYRTYMCSELVFVIGNFPNSSPSFPEHITLLARTRRFAKLLSYVKEAKEKGDVESVIAAMDATVKRFIEERRRTTEKIERLMEEEPEVFRPGAPESLRIKSIDLLQGFGLTGLDVPEGVIPMSLTGTQLGVVANTFLLGMTEHPSAMKPLLDIVAYDDGPLFAKLAKAWGYETSGVKYDFFIRNDFTFENRVVMADALDRIMMAYSQNQTANDSSLAVAQQYAQWRQRQNFSQRETVKVFSHDSPQTPHHLPGYVLGVAKDESGKTKTTTLELPLKLVLSDTDLVPDEKVIGPIIEFAKRFQAALDDK